MRVCLCWMFVCSVGGGLEGAESLLIGIVGGTASGKTRFAEQLKSELGDRAVIVCQDRYYRDNLHLSLEERAAINYDHPDSLDFPQMREDLLALKIGQTVTLPSYDFRTHSRKLTGDTVDYTPVIIVEGILLLAAPEVRDLFDIKVFVDTPADVRIIRRIQRDIIERGRTLEGVAEQYMSTVRPMHEEFVEPSKKFADIIVPSIEDTSTAMGIIASKLAVVDP